MLFPIVSKFKTRNVFHFSYDMTYDTTASEHLDNAVAEGLNLITKSDCRS